MRDARTRPWQQVAAIVLVALLAACASPGTYPVSGNQCGPNDPVRDLDKQSCDPF